MISPGRNRLRRLPCRSQAHRPLDRIDDAREFDERAVAEHLEQHSVPLRQGRHDEFGEQPVERASVATSSVHEATEIDEIEGGDRGQPPLGIAPGRPFTAPEDRADACDEFPQFAGLGEIIVGAEFETDHPVDGAGRGGQHDDGTSAILFQEPDELKARPLRAC